MAKQQEGGSSPGSKRLVSNTKTLLVMDFSLRSHCLENSWDKEEGTQHWQADQDWKPPEESGTCSGEATNCELNWNKQFYLPWIFLCSSVTGCKRLETWKGFCTSNSGICVSLSQLLTLGELRLETSHIVEKCGPRDPSLPKNNRLR